MWNNQPIIMCSLWRNDASKNIVKRADHLLSKEGVDAWFWAVGDSEDETFTILAEKALSSGRNVTVSITDSGIFGEEPNIRLHRLSISLNRVLDRVYEGPDGLFLLHESDLLSPPDVALQFASFLGEGRDVVAGWVTLGDTNIFYDTWAYRESGRMFSNGAPYHACYNAQEPFELESVGSCWMARVADMRGLYADRLAVLDMMRGLKQNGKHIWCIPKVHIIQPVELWESRQHAAG